MNVQKINSFSAANLCVKCGLCLPHCPTYQLTQDENESPRGRIALMQGVGDSKLPVNANLIRHLDSCLMCRSCESVCPASVPYGELVDNFRARFGKNKLPWLTRLKSRIFRIMLDSRNNTAALNGIIRRYQRSWFASLLDRSECVVARRMSFTTKMLPKLKKSSMHPEFYAPGSKEVGAVALFTGCTGELVDRETIDAAVSLITKLGYRVYVAKNQVCCGAIDLHAGQMNRAFQLFKTNLQVFDQDRFDAIVTIASGCGAMLKEYSIHNDAVTGSEQFSKKILDISHFVSACPTYRNLLFKSASMKVFLHTPCSLKNVMRQERGVHRMLGAIPGLKVLEQPNSVNCCGAAGTYMVDYPKSAKAIRKWLIDSVIEMQPDYLISSNVGCAMHLREGLRNVGSGLEVLHPVILVERLLK